jgi:hypothetical protein
MNHCIRRPRRSTHTLDGNAPIVPYDGAAPVSIRVILPVYAEKFRHLSKYSPTASMASCETPIGTCMVSSDGACAAYYNLGRLHHEAAVSMGRSA